METYSFLWGRRNAVISWLAAMVATLACAGMAAERIAFVWPVLLTLGIIWLLAATLGMAFLRSVNGRQAKHIELCSGGWTLALYLMLGVAPLLLSR